MTLYDSIGRSYRSTRIPDPRIAAAISSALGDAQSVLDVGAGAGSYEPPQTVVAIEPSRIMLEQRTSSQAPAVQAIAEQLPLRDDCVDAAMAVLTVHHWSDLAAGIAELRRVARRRIVVFTWLPEVMARFWLLSDYLPEARAVDEAQAVPVDHLLDLLGGGEVLAVPIPHDCSDGFGAAYWRRPEAYLSPQVRAGMSMLAKTGEEALAPGLSRLAGDLESGRWQRRYRDLLTLESLDVGYCVVRKEL